MTLQLSPDSTHRDEMNKGGVAVTCVHYPFPGIVLSVALACGLGICIVLAVSLGFSEGERGELVSLKWSGWLWCP